MGIVPLLLNNLPLHLRIKKIFQNDAGPLTPNVLGECPPHDRDKQITVRLNLIKSSKLINMCVPVIEDQ